MNRNEANGRGAIYVPGARLHAAAELAAVPLFAGETKKLCAIDVGTDHANLAVYLIQSGICSHVTATDIAKGPCNVARTNIARRTDRGKRLEDRIDVVQTDGLMGLSHITCERIFITGMGGMLIRDILSRADWLKRPERAGKILLILQPMSDEYTLRLFLADAGFYIRDETMVQVRGRIYTVMAAYYDGVKRSFSQAALLFGDKNLEHRAPLLTVALTRKIRLLELQRQAWLSAGKALTPEMDALISQLKDWQDILSTPTRER